MNELRTIPNFAGYAITKDGRVWSYPKQTSSGNGLQHFGKWLSPRLNHGYKIVTLTVNNKFISRRIHRLVLETFIGPCPQGMQCRHLNGVKTDNRLSNLKWGTPKENSQDNVKHGKTQGENNGRAKLSARDIKTILYLRNKFRMPLRLIAWLFDVTRPNIGYICRGITWQPTT